MRKALKDRIRGRKELEKNSSLPVPINAAPLPKPANLPGHYPSTISKRGDPDPVPSADSHASRTSSDAESSMLWEDAYHSLQQQKPDLVANYEAIITGNGNLTQENLSLEMSAVVDLQRQRMENRQWTFQWFGQPRTIRETISTILSLVQGSSALVSMGMTFAPLYVSMPWSALCVLIPLIMNDTNEFRSALDGLKTVTALLSSYRIAEKLFLRSEVTKTIFRDSVMPLYVQILDYQASAAQYFGRSSLKRWGRSLQGSDTWQASLENVSRLDHMCRLSTQFLSTSLLDANTRSIADVLRGGDKKVDELIRMKLQSQSGCSQVVEWVSSISHSQDHYEAKHELGHEYFHSGAWLVQSAEYISWTSSNTSVLHLKGTVGTGKTCLVSVLVDELLCNDTGHVAYFYCSGNKTQHHPNRTVHSDSTNIFRSLLVQSALSQDGLSIAEPVMTRFERSDRKEFGGCDFGLPLCVSLLHEICTAGSRRQFTIVLDALDECADVEEVLNSLRILQNSGTDIRIFVSSRDGIPVKEYLQNVTTVEIASQNTADIRRYLVKEIQKRRGKEIMTDDQIDRLTEVLVERAEGMFRWVVLKLDMVLKKGISTRWELSDDIELKIQDLEKSESTIHEKLAKAYDDIYQAAINFEQSPRRKEVVSTALKLVFCAVRALSSQEVAYACSFRKDGSIEASVDENYILGVCSNLLTKSTTGEMKVAHFSVKEHFMQNMLSQYSLPEQHASVALVCLTVKLFSPSDTISSQSRKHSILSQKFDKYVSVYWARHCRAAADKDTLASLLSRLKQAALAGLSRDTDVVSPLSAFSDPSTWTVRDAVRSGRDDLVSILVAEKARLDVKDEFGNTALHEAIRLNHVSTIRALLNVDALANESNLNHDTAAHVAAFWGSSDALRLLIEFGMRLDDPNRFAHRPLHLAAFQGHKTVARALISSGCNVNAMDNEGNTPLHYAVLANRINSVEAILAGECVVDIQNHSGDTALHYAGRSGNLVLGKILCNKMANLSVRNAAGRTPIEEANSRGHSRFTEDEVGPRSHKIPWFGVPGYGSEFKNPRDSLCAYCDLESWFQNSRFGFRVRHRPSLTDLSKSAIDGCVLCSLFMEELEHQKQSDSVRFAKDTAVFVQVTLAVEQQVRRGRRDLLEVFVGDSCHITLELCLDAGADEGLSSICGRIVPEHPGLSSSINLLGQWMTRCVTYHDNCGQHGDSPLPHRIVELNPSGSTVRLRTTPKELGRFVYLSYPWGGVRPFLLTSQNYATLHEGIEVDRLPKTLQDAIQVAQQLEIQYLWVDALCIIHDDRQDYVQQLAMMPRYLASAYVVIAAAAAKNAHDNILKGRAGPFSLLQLKYSGGKDSNAISTIHLRRPHPTTREVLSHIVFRRAWMIQESVLPARTIIFGQEQLYWSCRTELRSEGSTIIEDPPITFTRSLEKVFSLPSASLLLDQWYRIVEVLSKATMSDYGNKLKASLGMARSIHDDLDSIQSSSSSNSDRCIGGLWDKDLSRGLLWRIGLLPAMSSPILKRAPSWSWAGVQGPISYRFVQGLGKFPSVDDAVITEERGEAEDFQNFGDSNIQALLPSWWREVLMLRLEGRCRSSSLQAPIGGCEYIFDLPELEDEWRKGAEYVCVLVQKWAPGVEESGSRWLGLIIGKVKGSTQEKHSGQMELHKKRNAYKRVGFLLGPVVADGLDGWGRDVFSLV